MLVGRVVVLRGAEERLVVLPDCRVLVELLVVLRVDWVLLERLVVLRVPVERAGWLLVLRVDCEALLLDLFAWDLLP